MSQGDEKTGSRRYKKPNRMRPLYPVIGAVIIALGAVLGWFGSEPIYNYLINNVAGVPPEPALRYVIAGAIFLIVVMVIATVYSAAQKKPEFSVSERELDREKQERLKEKEAAKRRQKAMRERMRSQRNKGKGK